MRRLSTMLLAGLLVLIGSAPGEAAAPSERPESEARCLSAQSLDDLFVIPAGFTAGAVESDSSPGWARRVFHDDTGGWVMEDVRLMPSPSEAIRRAASLQASLADDDPLQATIAIACGAYVHSVTVRSVDAQPDESSGPGSNPDGPLPPAKKNPETALTTTLNMIG